jgi:hypothetical protein
VQQALLAVGNFLIELVFSHRFLTGARNGNKKCGSSRCENPARTFLEAGFAASGFYLCVLCHVLCDLCG